MPLGDPYATLPQLKAYLLGSQMAATDTLDDNELTDALESASAEIEDHCDRQFNDAGTASPRLYKPLTSLLVLVDDFHTTTGLVVESDDDGDGVYETTWAAADYQLEPLNGVVGGRPGWPFCRIRAVGSRRFGPMVQVTARWGWAAVPAPVHQSALILAAETHKLRSAPFGVAGFGEFGVVRVRNNPMVAKKLRRYERNPVLVA